MIERIFNNINIFIFRPVIISMSNIPVPVAVGAVIQNNHILLIKRVRGSYTGMWALPGGKIEKDEHLSEAAVREVQEECGLKTTFMQHLGFVSEHLVQNGKINRHFLLHICHLHPDTTITNQGGEGESKWFPLDTIDNMGDMVPSDVPIIQKMIKNKEKTLLVF